MRRIRYLPNNQPPVAALDATATAAAGTAPLTVNFHASGSTDADPADQGRLTYTWDFTNDGTLQYSFNQPVLRTGNGVLFHPPA